MKIKPATTLRHACCASAMALTALSVGAQTQAPGLWEHVVSMKSPGGEMENAMAEMQKQMAAMSPGQRRQMEQMMSSRGVTLGAQGTTVKVCVTQEQAARPAEARLGGDCKQQDVQRSGNSMTFRFECTRPEALIGEGDITFPSDKAYTGKTRVTRRAGDKPQQMTMEMSGKWLSADCGDIKPVAKPGQ
jgi:hypothetical protein